MTTDKKPVVAHILPWSSVGGTEQATIRVARAVAGRYQSIAYCLSDADSVRGLFSNEGIPTATYEPIEHSIRYLPRYLGQSRRLAADFKKHDVDMIHCADILAAARVGLAGKLAGLPVLCHVRNRFDVVPWRDRLVLSFVDRFIFVSRNTQERFGRKVSAAKANVVYDGIDPKSERCDRASVLNEFGLPPDAVIAGMFARVSEQKDYPTLIRAAATLISRFPQLYFLIVGDHQLSPEHRAHYAKIAALITDAQLTGHFIFAGFRTDVPRLLAATDISLLSTHWEGLPLVILEAMAQSKPVIATDVDGVHEAVVAGSTGLLYPHEDAVALASCITQLVDDPARRIAMGMEGRKRIEQGFSQASFSEGMLSVYDATL